MVVYRTLKELDSSEGTVQLVDFAALDVQSGSNLLHLEGTSILLVPQPSSDPNDPLRWPQWKKYVIFINICLYSFLNNCFIGGISSAFFTLSQDYRKSISTTSGLLVYPILVLGLGNFLIVPLSIYIGKRPVFVTCSLVLLVCNIWSAVATTFENLLAARIVASITGSATEALSAAFVNDLFFLHERGHKMMVYIIFLASGNSIGPLVSGFVITSLSWKWFCWILTIFCAISFVFVFFLVPETRHERNYNLSQTTVGSDEGEKNATDATAIEYSAASNESSTYPAKRSYTSSLNPWSGITPGHSFWNIFIRPFPLMAYPAVFWGFLSYSVCLALVIAVGSVYSFVLQVPPYNMTAGIAGLINVPTLFGFVVGAISGGYLTDVFSARRARRRDGVFLPEDRLVLLLVPAITVPVGCLMFGFGAQQQLHWAVIFVGYGFISVGLTGVASIGMTYVLDSYYPIAAEALLLVNGLKNVVAFGFLHGIVPWTTVSGYQTVFGAMAGIFLAIMALAIPLYIYGASIRHHTSMKFQLISW